MSELTELSNRLKNKYNEAVDLSSEILHIQCFHLSELRDSLDRLFPYYQFDELSSAIIGIKEAITKLENSKF